MGIVIDPLKEPCLVPNTILGIVPEAAIADRMWFHDPRMISKAIWISRLQSASLQLLQLLFLKLPEYRE
jgi:hypothetical protein